METDHSTDMTYVGEYTMNIMEVAEQTNNDDRSLLLHTLKCCVACFHASIILNINNN